MPDTEYIYRRTTTVGDDDPVTETTFDYKTWDRWVDELVGPKAPRGDVTVALHSARITWGDDQAPVLARIVARLRDGR